MLFTDKVAIVTGAGGGLGLAYARALAKEGARVVIAEIDEAAGRAAAGTISADGGEALYLATDISSESATQAMAASALRAYGRIDILISNAALFAELTLKPLEEIPLAEWDAVMGVNLRGTFLAAKAVLPHMKAAGAGKIVNITSNTVFSGAPLMAQYVTSKAGIIGFTRSLAREVGRHGICVNAVAPGLTDTEGAKNLMPDERFEAVTKLRALPRRQTPDDLVGTVLFLCSPDSDFITGQVFNVDGGQIMY